MRYRKNIVLYSVCFLIIGVLLGCSTSYPLKDGKGYRAELLIGQKRDKILALAEPVFGQPKQEGKVFADQPSEVEVRRYAFTNLSDFVMYFHKGLFIQAALMPAASPLYPTLRVDYQEITAKAPGPVVGYVLIKDEGKVVVDTLPIAKK